MAQIVCPYLYDIIKHQPHTPLYMWSPLWDNIFDFGLWVFGFGYMTGSMNWSYHESEYHLDDKAG